MLEDKMIVCGCGNEFVFSVKDQEFYKERGFPDPKRCRNCRFKKKEEYLSREEQIG